MDIVDDSSARPLPPRNIDTQPKICPGCGERHPGYVELLPCPVCGAEHVHLDGGVGVEVEADAFWVEVPMRCGDGHVWVAFLEITHGSLFAGADRDRGRHQVAEPDRHLLGQESDPEDAR